jgi:hypothetical protein
MNQKGVSFWFCVIKSIEGCHWVAFSKNEENKRLWLLMCGFSKKRNINFVPPQNFHPSKHIFLRTLLFLHGKQFNFEVIGKIKEII